MFGGQYLILNYFVSILRFFSVINILIFIYLLLLYSPSRPQTQANVPASASHSWNDKGEPPCLTHMLIGMSVLQGCDYGAQIRILSVLLYLFALLLKHGFSELEACFLWARLIGQ